ncbi:MAG: class II aldolase/adducin family protein [candidate division WOR-3 bacterium]
MNRRELKLRKDIVQVGQELYEKGLIVATDGNISGRLSNRLILITPAGFCKGKLKQNEIVRLVIDKSIPKQTQPKPSSEYLMHIMIYKARPEINAIIHAHPVFATAIASTPIGKISKDQLFHLSEFQPLVGKVAMIDYLPPGSKELAQAVATEMTQANVVIMARHGVVVANKNLTEAFFCLERIELAAKLFILTQLINQFSK